MFINVLLFIFIPTILSQHRTADDMFASILGDVNEYAKKLDPPKTYSESKSFHTLVLELSKNMSDLIKNESTTQKAFQVTPNLIKRTPNITEEYIQTRMRRMGVMKLINDNESPIPNFANDMELTQITRRFSNMKKEYKATEKSPSRRVPYFSYEWGVDRERMRYEKRYATSIMAQFIYMIQYKLPYLQLLRKKYGYHLKYKIGYCFALLAGLKQQQKMLYSSLHWEYTYFNTLMFHLKIYEKVVRLDVDIKDVCALIRNLNYRQKLEDYPDYYDEIESANNATNKTDSKLTT